MTRRQLAALAVGSIAVGSIAAGTGLAITAMAQAVTPPDYLQAARDSKQAAADELAKFPLNIVTEPAFQFKA